MAYTIDLANVAFFTTGSSAQPAEAHVDWTNVVSDHF